MSSFSLRANPACVRPRGEGKVACGNCSLFQLCLPAGIGEPDVALLDRIVERPRPLPRGRELFRIGDPFRCFYAVRSGSVKTYTLAVDGSERVTGFHLPGELVGLDGLATGRHQSAAVTLDTVSVCEVPFERFEQLWKEVPSLPRQMMRVMSMEIHNDQILLMQLGKKSAEERFASFLAGLSARYRRRGFSAAEFHISMSRVDIGNYLGLADETVSRLFTRFQEEGLLAVERRHIRLLDASRLQAVAQGLPERASSKVYIGGGMYSKAPAKTPAPEIKDDGEFPAWDPMYRIGIEVIDEQHQRLFDISHRVYAACRGQARPARLCRLFDELLEYTRYHFAEEERLMERIGYPALAQHRANHEELVELVHHHRRQLAEDGPGAARRALAFVRAWLCAHVLDADKDIGVYLTGRRAGNGN
jgi:CRP/FNR family transcriptional regulator